jgi:hypothetical protein
MAMKAIKRVKIMLDLASAFTSISIPLTLPPLWAALPSPRGRG